MTIKYIASGSMNGGTGGATPAIPTGTVKNDFMIMLCMTANEALSAPSGWTEVANSPQGTGTAASAGGVRLCAFYKIAGSSESAPTVADSGDVTYARISSFRYVNTTNPINTTAGAVDTSASTSVSFPSVTTTSRHCMILNCVGIDDDASDASNVTSYSNSNLASITEAYDQGDSDGTGGGMALAYGLIKSAGSTGNTTATADSSNNRAYITIALNEDTSTPSYVGSGTMSGGTGGTGSLTMPPMIEENDLILLLYSTDNATLSTPSGYTLLTATDGTGTAGSAGAVKGMVFYKFAGASEGNASIPLLSTFKVGVAVAFRGIDATNPFNTYATGLDTTATSSLSCPTVTTTSDNCVIVNMIALDYDTASDVLSSWDNSSLISISEEVDECISSGVGGGIGMAYGVKSSAGSVSATTVTEYAAKVQAYVTMALLPASTATNISVTSPIASSTSSGIVPAVTTTRSVIVSSVTASSTATALAPAVSAQRNVSISVITAESTVTGIVPVVTTSSTNDALINAVTAQSNAVANAPYVTAERFVTIISQVAEATASAIIPTVSTSALTSTLYVKVSDAWKTVTNTYVKVGGVWKECTISINQNSTWIT